MLILFLTSCTIAQTAIGVDLNNIYMPINRYGVLADVNVGPQGSLGRYPGPTGKGFLFSGGFFLSGYSDTTLWANGVYTSGNVEDFLAGPVGSDPDDENNIIYTVLESDTPFGESWQNWSNAVEQGAYFYDGDGNGIYDPVDHNGNGAWDADEDKPDILYDGTYFTVYNDSKPADERRFTEVEPLGIEIRQTIFASNQNSVLDDVLFVRYSLVYIGTNNPNEPDSLTEVFFSVYTDSDIGATAASAGDDKVACDTLLQSGYTYNDGEDDDWGINPPAIFKTIVQGPLVKSDDANSIGYNKMGSAIGETVFNGYKNLKMTTFTSPQKSAGMVQEPKNQFQVNNYQVGQDDLGNEIDPCSFAFGEVRGDLDCSQVNNKYWFSGDPVTDYGWIYKPTSDIRDMVTTGSFTLKKNEPMDIIVAYVVGQGTDALNSIDRAREITQYVHDEYDRNFSTIVSVDNEHKEVVNEFSLSQNYPNPFNPTSKIKYQIAKLGKVELKVYDILGREITTLVNDIKAPGIYEVTFNASQLASGVYFYRLISSDFVQTKKMMVIK